AEPGPIRGRDVHTECSRLPTAWLGASARALIVETFKDLDSNRLLPTERAQAWVGLCRNHGRAHRPAERREVVLALQHLAAVLGRWQEEHGSHDDAADLYAAVQERTEPGTSLQLLARVRHV